MVSDLLAIAFVFFGSFQYFQLIREKKLLKIGWFAHVFLTGAIVLGIVIFLNPVGFSYS